MRKRWLILFWVLLLGALFAAYYVGLPFTQPASPVEAYQTWAWSLARAMGGAAWGGILYQWVVPAILALLAVWQLGAARRAQFRDRFTWMTSFLTALVVVLGLFFAFTNHSGSMYDIRTVNNQLDEATKKVQLEVDTRVKDKKPVPMTGDTISLKELLGFANCPGVEGGGECAWKFTLQADNQVQFANKAQFVQPNPAFTDLTTGAGIGVVLGWLFALVGVTVNFYLWAERTGNERVGIDLIYEQGIPSA